MRLAPAHHLCSLFSRCCNGALHFLFMTLLAGSAHVPLAIRKALWVWPYTLQSCTLGPNAVGLKTCIGLHYGSLTWILFFPPPTIPAMIIFSCFFVFSLVSAPPPADHYILFLFVHLFLVGGGGDPESRFISMTDVLGGSTKVEIGAVL